MKKILLLMMCCPMILSAQNGVTVSNLVANSGTVTFNVSWKSAGMPAPWSDSVWVFVDYNHAGRMERLPLSGATLSVPTWSAATVIFGKDGNKQGAWVVGNARSAGSFSATVQVLTSQLDVAGACAYASNYPPVGEYETPTQIKFTGTPMYNLVLKHQDNETDTIYRVSGGIFDLPQNYTLVSFTDATGAPGRMKCIVPATFALQASALSFCEGSEGVQFALSGTEDGRHYQLYRDGAAVDGAALEGNGNAATFNGAFNVAGTYTAWTIADKLYCATAMNGMLVVVENLLPDNPIAYPPASRNCPGTLTLSASSSGAVIDWYANAAATTTLHTGASYTTPEIETSATYYAQARIENTGCLSARVPVLAEVITENCCTYPGSTVTFAEFDPCANTAIGTVWYLIDTREETLGNTQTYKVKLMADGHIWMVQDLKFGSGCNKSTYTSPSSNQSNKVTSLTDKTYYGDCREPLASGTGYLYDWPAAVNKSNAYSGGSELGCIGTTSGVSGTAPGACQGPCPPGWHVPTGDTAGEFKNYYNVVSATSHCTGSTCWNAASAWEGSSVGRMCCSYTTDLSVPGYWSSTAPNGATALQINSASYLRPGNGRTDAFNVRCLMTY